MPFVTPSRGTRPSASFSLQWSTLERHAQSGGAALQERRAASSFLSSSQPRFRVVLADGTTVAAADTEAAARRDWRVLWDEVAALPAPAASDAEVAARVAARVEAAEAFRSAAPEPPDLEDDAARPSEHEARLEELRRADREWVASRPPEHAGGGSALDGVLGRLDAGEEVFPLPPDAAGSEEERWALLGLLASLAARQLRRELRLAVAGGASLSELPPSHAMWVQYVALAALAAGLDGDGDRVRATAGMLDVAARPRADPEPFAAALGDRGVALAAAMQTAVAQAEGLDARAQELARQATRLLGAPWRHALRVERALAARLQESMREESAGMSSGGRERSAAGRTRGEKLKIGGLVAAGAALTALTAGLAAPALVAAAGAAGMTAVGTGTTVTAFGALGGKVVHGKASRRYADVTEFRFEPHRPRAGPAVAELAGGGAGAREEKAAGDDEGRQEDQQKLPVLVLVSGFLVRDAEGGRDPVHAPWDDAVGGVAPLFDAYALRWETDELLALGSVARKFALSQAKGYAAKQVLMRTALGGVLAAAAFPLTVIAAADVIDNEWSVVDNKACKASLALAETLLTGAHGRRPVTLVAYSAGALLVLLALEELARRKAYGIVHDVVLMGTPSDADPARWLAARPVVAGRLVNGFCYTDWMLRFVLRSAKLKSGRLAGLGPVRHREIENVDLTEALGGGHTKYATRMAECLDAVGLFL